MAMIMVLATDILLLLFAIFFGLAFFGTLKGRWGSLFPFVHLSFFFFSLCRRWRRWLCAARWWTFQDDGKKQSFVESRHRHGFPFFNIVITFSIILLLFLGYSFAVSFFSVTFPASLPCNFLVSQLSHSWFFLSSSLYRLLFAPPSLKFSLHSSSSFLLLLLLFLFRILLSLNFQSSLHTSSFLFLFLLYILRSLNWIFLP